MKKKIKRSSRFRVIPRLGATAFLALGISGLASVSGPAQAFASTNYVGTLYASNHNGTIYAINPNTGAQTPLTGDTADISELESTEINNIGISSQANVLAYANKNNQVNICNISGATLSGCYVLPNFSVPDPGTNFVMNVKVNPSGTEVSILVIGPFNDNTQTFYGYLYVYSTSGELIGSYYSPNNPSNAAYGMGFADNSNNLVFVTSNLTTSLGYSTPDYYSQVWNPSNNTFSNQQYDSTGLDGVSYMAQLLDQNNGPIYSPDGSVFAYYSGQSSDITIGNAETSSPAPSNYTYAFNTVSTIPNTAGYGPIGWSQNEQIPVAPGGNGSGCTQHISSGNVVGGAATPNGQGYYEVTSDGQVAVFGNAVCYGSMAGHPLNQPIVGMAVDPQTGGYWLVASDGGIFSFNAPFLGSMGGHPLNKPVVGMASTPNGQGYWEVASDGGIFTFGNAPFLGSMGGHPLNKPVVGMASLPNGQGYWEVASDGGIFSFGAPFYGSMGGKPLNKPVVGFVTDSSNGYWLVAQDGGIFSFNVPFYGSAA